MACTHDERGEMAASQPAMAMAAAGSNLMLLTPSLGACVDAIAIADLQWSGVTQQSRVGVALPSFACLIISLSGRSEQHRLVCAKVEMGLVPLAWCECVVGSQQKGQRKKPKVLHRVSIHKKFTN